MKGVQSLPERGCHPTNSTPRPGGSPDANRCTREGVKDTDGEDLPFQRLGADLPPGAFQQLPEPVDPHDAPGDGRGGVAGGFLCPILPQPAPPPGPGTLPLLPLLPPGEDGKNSERAGLQGTPAPARTLLPSG